MIKNLTMRSDTLFENTQTYHYQKYLSEFEDYFQNQWFSFFLNSFEKDIQDFLKRNLIPRPNETSRWIEQQGISLVIDLQGHLTRKMPRSHKLTKIEDHVGKFIEDIIRRDAIGKRNAKGQKTYISQVRAWCLRNAHTQNRDAGVDALGRCMHGALTRKEWTSNQFSAENWTTTIIPRDLKDPAQIDLNCLESPNTSPNKRIEDSDSMDKLLNTIRKVLDKGLPKKNIEKHMTVLYMFFLEQQKVKEIAGQINLPAREVTRMINQIRKVLRKEETSFSWFRLVS